MATTTMDANEIIARSTNLKKFWDTRRKKFKEWYKQIQLVDELASENMESFVSSDPRSAYNLLLHMLNSPRIPHRIPPELITPDLVRPSGELSKLLDAAWSDVYRTYRMSGHQSWLRDLIGYMLATGWYAVFATTSLDGSRCIAELWNPATVYPAWDDQLVECAHILTLSPSAAIRMVARNKWSIERITTNQTLYDYWYIADDGITVVNTIALNRVIVKPPTAETKFSRIPIFTAPVGGLPDTGIITEDAERWKGEIGQSSVATAEGVYRSMNKWWTFSMQLLRDTAQARWYEKTSGTKPILKKEDLYKRGFIARLGPNDEIGTLPVPPIPVELRSTQIDLEAMIQRAGPPWALYGANASNMTAYTMSQVASGAAQMAQPFHQGVIDVLSDIDNFWLDLIRKHGGKPYGIAYPKEIPETMQVTASYEIRIPGDIIQRATVARMLDPDYRLSSTRVTEELFPEIKNPMEEKAQVMADKAELHPIRSYISLILSLRQEAVNLRKTNQPEAARLYEAAANNIESQLGVQEQTQAPASEQPPVSSQTQPNRERLLNGGQNLTPVQ
jgi:hypothetical protein